MTVKRETRDAVAEVRVVEAPRERAFVVESHAISTRMTYRAAVAEAFRQTSPTTTPWFASVHGNLGIIQPDGGVTFPDGSEPPRDCEGMPITSTRTCVMCAGHGKRISIESGRRDEQCSCENGRVPA